jgi:hypothetical protein
MDMISKYLKNTVLEKILGQKRGIIMGFWSKTGEFHNARRAANITVTE